jgi:hypothetical protein
MALRGGAARVPESFRIVTDTSDFTRVENGDVMVLGGVPLWIRSYEREGRFGLDEEPKYWVRRAIDLTDGSVKIVKFVFHETFETSIGEVVVRRFRSPEKEARILDLVRGHESFMQGRGILDEAGNRVRVLEFIRGPRYDEVVAELGRDHLDYFHSHLPRVLGEFVELAGAIKFLHDRCEKHGDVRRDHIIRDRESGRNRWIDFDYNYQHGESMFRFDLQGLGNILIFLAGRGDVLVPELRRKRPELLATLSPGDLNILYPNRVANLQKIYPYIPDALNLVLRHFSAGANVFYDTTDQMLADLAEAQRDLAAATGGKT